MKALTIDEVIEQLFDLRAMIGGDKCVVLPYDVCGDEYHGHVVGVEVDVDKHNDKVACLTSVK